MKKIFKEKDLIVFEYISIIGILILGVFICMNTYEINKLAKKNNELEYRIKLLETKNALYESISEYEVEDVNKDGVVDISDLAIVKSRMLRGK